MNGNVIALAVDLIKGFAVFDGSGKIPCSVNGNIRIIAVNLHSQMSSRIGNHGSNGSQADDSKLFAADLAACKLLFLLLRKLINVFLVLLTGYPLNAAHNVAGGKEHSCNYQLLYTVGIGPRGVKNNDSLFRAGINRNIIYTGAGAGNSLYRIAKLHIMHLGASYKNSIRFIDIFCFCVILTEHVQASFGNGIQAVILKHYAFSSSNFFIKATRASTPSFGIAL